MSYKEDFKNYWDEASDTLKYRLITDVPGRNIATKKIFTNDEINKIIKEELFNKRFLSERKHPAGKWLDDLEKVNYECAKEISTEIISYKSTAGIKIFGVAKKACTELTIGTAATFLLKKARPLVFSATMIIAAGHTAYDIFKTANSTLKIISGELDKISNNIYDILERYNLE